MLAGRAATQGGPATEPASTPAHHTTTSNGVHRLAVDLFNYEAGGLSSDGRYDFDRLVEAFHPGRVPHVILLNEAKYWHRRGCTPLYQATNALSAALGRPYAALLGTSAMASAILYDPTVLTPESWNEIEFADKRQLGRFVMRGSGTRFAIIVDQWSPVDGDARLARARQLAPYGDSQLPVLLAGDLNCTADGQLLPQRDWTAVPEHRRAYKGRQDVDGTWGPDTRALGLLIGGWDERTDRRETGRVWHALPDLAYAGGAPAELAYRATTNEQINTGGELVNDWMLINDVWLRAGGLAGGSYQVHIPPGRTPAECPSDHRRISADLLL
ncbi:endonuclease/exonuclease/phosphatase family protein [Actinocatenispora comari]|nr:endonuclease/exonuclease/phosphatase family protein [Actinocatenispora comari]